MRKPYRVILLFFVFFISFFPLGFALETDTHEGINEFTAINTLNTFSLDAYLQNQLGFANGVYEEIEGNWFWFMTTKKPVWGWIKIGGKYEDNPILTPPYLRSVNHFHNPLTEQGFSGIWGTDFLLGQSSINWSHTSIGNQYPGGHYSWYDVRDYLYMALTSTDNATRETYYAETFRGLGQLMHLVEDLSVPEHTRDDGHYVEAYEAWVKENGDDGEKNVKIFPGTGIVSIRNADLQNYTNTTPIFFDSSALGYPNPLAPVPFANLFDTDQYNGTNPDITLQSNIGLSEYTNANFLSPDSMFTSSFPYPSWSSVVEYDEVIDSVTGKKRTYLKKISDGETINHLAAGRWFYRYLPSNIKSMGLTFDDRVYSDYAQLLIPRAVGYAAGLLNYFFRGDVYMMSDFDLGSGYVIVNNTDEDVNGTFELLYDNTNDERVSIANWTFSLGSKSSGNNKSPNISFIKPTDGKEDCTYILVFRGQMGQEQDAVAGRVLY